MELNPATFGSDAMVDMAEMSDGYHCDYWTSPPLLPQ